MKIPRTLRYCYLSLAVAGIGLTGVTCSDLIAKGVFGTSVLDGNDLEITFFPGRLVSPSGFDALDVTTLGPTAPGAGVLGTSGFDTFGTAATVPITGTGTLGTGILGAGSLGTGMLPGALGVSTLNPVTIAGDGTVFPGTTTSSASIAASRFGFRPRFDTALTPPSAGTVIGSSLVNPLTSTPVLFPSSF